MHVNRPAISLGNTPSLSPSTYVAYTGILLLLAILLASCAGGSSSGGGSSNPSPIGLSAASEQGAIVLRWTNPSAEELAKLITENGGNASIPLEGFRISYFRAQMSGNVTQIDITTLNTTASAEVIWSIPTKLQSQNNTDLWVFMVNLLLENNETIEGGSISILVGNDTDEDGNVDIVDPDDDNDGVLDGADICPRGETGWTSNPATDNEGDGCRDSDEDTDDDNDGVKDTLDRCRRGETGWISNSTSDYDGDGCRDRDRDPDDDNDGVLDGDDTCSTGATGWTSHPSLDNDGDGCRDSDEDTDDDNDGVKDAPDRCPRGETEWTSNSNSDNDSDGCRDSDEDMDADGDSLIEIFTLDDLHTMRDDLDGNGVDDRMFQDVTALGNTGCPSNGCTGYELMNNLSFTDNASYASGSINPSWTTGAGWPGIGSCTTVNSCTDFSGNFNGNGFTIANLSINASSTTHGVGLFAAANGTMRNLILMDARVTGGSTDIGVLIGYGNNADIRNVSSHGVVDSAGGSVGGLIGDGDFATVVNSYAAGSVSGDASAGGLIGVGTSANVTYSYASGSVRGDGTIGGLIGYGERANVTNSYATGYVNGTEATTGGLIGDGGGANVLNSYTANDVSGTLNVGGLIGSGINVNVENSYATGSVSGTSKNVGGLIGDGGRAKITNSYATGFVSGTRDVGGLIGEGNSATVTASYWDTTTTGQTTSSGGGTGRTTMELQSPIGFTGSIYANWDSAMCADGTGAWHLGTASQYPVLTCTPGGIAEQR